MGQADIVFVQEVEGAQTRLVAVYHSKLPTRLGPVRSARTTDAELLPLFGKPGLVYSGANGRVQRRLDGASLVPIYRETRDRRRVAPHNVFVDLARIARTEGAGKARPIGWTFAGKTSQGEGTEGRSKVGNDVFASLCERPLHVPGAAAVRRWRQRAVPGRHVGSAVRNVPDGNRDCWLGLGDVQASERAPSPSTGRAQARRELGADKGFAAAVNDRTGAIALRRPEMGDTAG